MSRAFSLIKVAEGTTAAMAAVFIMLGDFNEGIGVGLILFKF